MKNRDGEKAEIWDGYNRDETLAGVDLVRGRAVPKGLYHLVCEVLVQHTDGEWLLMQRSYTKRDNRGRYVATAGGAALKGENKFDCVKRELFEETGIAADEFTELGCFVYDEDRCIIHVFYCVTDCEKKSIRLQPYETIAYKWVSERNFVRFINSDRMMPRQKQQYHDFFEKRGLLRK
ncbi:MAG: NUDIX hydrolase [Firmicutes bacterium]|nr:NUDIX hydrolase [Bacillota bacterium]